MSDTTQRYVVCALMVVVGILLIRVGRQNIRTLTAEESGHARLTNLLLDNENSYHGSRARVVGIGRVVMGIVFIVVAILVGIFGPLVRSH